jgi:hypothetical protein
MKAAQNTAAVLFITLPAERCCLLHQVAIDFCLPSATLLHRFYMLCILQRFTWPLLLRSYLCCLLRWVAVDSCADSGEGQVLQPLLVGQRKAAPTSTKIKTEYKTTKVPLMTSDPTPAGLQAAACWQHKAAPASTGITARNRLHHLSLTAFVTYTRFYHRIEVTRILSR